MNLEKVDGAKKGPVKTFRLTRRENTGRQVDQPRRVRKAGPGAGYTRIWRGVSAPESRNKMRIKKSPTQRYQC